VLLINAVRALITLLGLLLGYTFQLAYGLTGIPMLLVASLILFAVFVAGDIAEAQLIAYFNPDETKGARP
jgi:hypothetical protein